MKKKSIIFIIPRNPFPPFSGFAKHSFFIAKYLKKFDYDVILISLNINLFKVFSKDYADSPFDKHYLLKLNFLDYCFTLFSICFSILKFKPVQLSFFESPFFKKQFKEILKKIIKENNVNFIHIFSLRTIKLWPILDNLNKPFLIDLIDSVGLTFETYSKNSFSPISELYKFEALALKKIESSMPNFRNLKYYSLVSRIDLDRIKISDCYEGKKYLYPIGIELNPQNKITTLPNKYLYDLIFFGSLNYKPNLTSISWFIKEVMPLLIKDIPNIKLLVTGFKPPLYLINLIENNPNIELIINPKKIEPFINMSKISIAPMLTGSGQQNKVIESMALNVPVVLSPTAAYPLNLNNMENCLIANKSSDYLYAIKLLLNNSKFRNQIGLVSREFVLRNHKWQSIVSNLVRDIYEN